MTSAVTSATQTRDPHLAAKITVPGLPGWVISRPRLTQRIVGGAAMPLTAVTGPPGAGKTMALALWAASRTAPGPVAWVNVDDHDNEPGTFWSYVVGALRKAGVPAPAPSPGDVTGRVFLVRLASALARQDPPAVLVLDDLHLITDPRLRQDLVYVLRYAQPGLHLMAAARTDLPLPVHRYRLSGELTEVRARDLAFTVPEAARLLAQHGIRLPAGTLELVTTRVEGWAAGLGLAALSLDGHPDPALVIKNLTAEDTAITSYLVAEVLDTQPAATRDLMLATSIAGRFTAELATDLTGNQQAGGTLAALARGNAFVQPLGDGWYRYHCLLAEVLRHQLQRESPGRVACLRRRAARWHQRNGLPGEAVAHAAQIGDWQLAAQVAVDELAVGDLLEPGDSSSYAARLRQMPDPPVVADGPGQPQLLLAAAALRLSDGRDHGCRGALGAAERLLDQVPAGHEAASRLTAALIRFAAARRAGSLGEAAAAAATAQELSGQLPDTLRARRPDTRAHVVCACGTVSLWSGDFAAAAAAFSAAAAAAPEGSREQASSHGHLALIEALCGRLSRAAELAAAGTKPPHGGLASHRAPAATVALALVHLERHEPAACRSRLKQADAALRASPDRLISALACLAAARGALAQARVPAAADLLTRARHGWSPPPWLDHLLTVAESRASAASGDTGAALAAAARAGAGLDASVALARAWLGAGDIQAARHLLTDPADDRAGPPVRLEAYLTDALISYRGGDQARGHRCLQRALTLAEPEGYRLSFVMDWAWLRPILERHRDLAAAGHWLLEPGQGSRGGRPVDPAGARPPAPVVAGRLTDREVEVLRYASSLLTTDEIALKMHISVNTVKSHFKNIFCKLGAAQRREAIHRARELDLI